jgi:hypothetical protein
MGNIVTQEGQNFELVYTDHECTKELHYLLINIELVLVECVTSRIYLKFDVTATNIEFIKNRDPSR